MQHVVTLLQTLEKVSYSERPEMYGSSGRKAPPSFCGFQPQWKPTRTKRVAIQSTGSGLGGGLRRGYDILLAAGAYSRGQELHKRKRAAATCIVKAHKVLTTFHSYVQHDQGISASHSGATDELHPHKNQIH